MNRRIGSWLRYTDPVSIAGMLTIVVGNAPMWFLKNVKPEYWRSISRALGLEDVVEGIGLKPVEHEVKDVLLRGELEDRLGRPFPLCARVRIGLRRRVGEQHDLQRDQNAAGEDRRRKQRCARRSARHDGTPSHSASS